MRHTSLLFVFCMGTFGFAVFGQSFHSRTYTEADGLQSTTVYDLTQDHAGVMWFATRTGLNSFDGVNWRLHDQQTGLTTAIIRKIAIDRHGDLWALGGRIPSRVFHYNGEKWTALPPVKGIRFLQQVNMTFIYEDDRTVPVLGYRGAGVFFFREGQWENMGVAQGLQGDNVNSLDSDGERLFVGTSQGISVITPDGIDNSFDRLLPRDHQTVLGLALDQHGGVEGRHMLWVMGQGRIGLIKDNRYILMGELPGVTNTVGDYGSVVYPDGDGGVFCGESAAIYHYNHREKTIEHFGGSQGLVDDGATALFRDREDNLWFSGLRGVTIIPSMRFANYDRYQGLLEDEVSALLEVSPGRLLLGHDSGFTVLSDGKPMPLPIRGPDDPRDVGLRVMDLRAGQDGVAWAALSRQGVARIDPDNTLTYFQPPGARDACYSVMVNRADGRVWVGGEKGLLTIEGDTMKPLKTGGLGSIPVRRLSQGPSGTIFLATSGGGLRTFDGEWQEFVFHNERANELYAVLEDSRFHIWVGTIAGLFRMVDGALEPFEAQNGQTIDRPVYSLTEDPQGRIWVGTDRGVYRLDGRRVRHFTMREGLSGDEVNRAAATIDSNGRFLVGTNRGLSIYRQGYDHSQPQPPLVSISGIEFGGQVFSADAPLMIHGGRRDLIFHFKAISFIDEENVVYRCRLRGFDNDWLPEFAPGRDYLRYTNLPPDEYVFEIKAANALGVWSEPVVSAVVTVLTPFWRSIPAMVVFLLVGLLCAVLAWVLHRRTEERIFERTAWLEDKNLELERFDAIVRSINNELELESLLGTLLRQAIGLFPDTDKGFVMIWDPQQQAFHFGATVGYSHQALSGYYLDYGMMTQGMDAKAKAGPGIFVHNTDKETFFPRAVDAIPLPKARLALTLELDDKIRGFLVFDNLNNSSAFDQLDVRRLGRLRTHAVSALAKARFLETLREKNAEILNAQRQLVLREKMASLGTLASGVAHEIRNPLNFINNFAALNLQIAEELSVRIRAQAARGSGEVQWQAIQDELAEVRDGARIISEHGKRAGNIIERMIQFTSFSNRSGERRPLNVSKLLEDQAASVMMTMGKKHKLKHLKVRKKCDEVLPPFEGNADELAFLFGQLLSNAYEALMEREQREPEHLSVLSYEATLQGDKVVVHIRDNGFGIPETMRSKVFAPFFTTREADSGNIGLGLFMSYEIAVNGYGGDIAVHRVDGITSFTLTLPMTEECALATVTSRPIIHPGSEG